MKPTVLTLFFLICFFVYGQKEEIKLENYVLQCDALAKSLIDKETLTDITSWYEGNGKELAKRSIEELENTIDKAPVEISHYLMAYFQMFKRDHQRTSLLKFAWFKMAQFSQVS